MSELTGMQKAGHVVGSIVFVNLLGFMCMISLAWAVADPMIGGVAFLLMLSAFLATAAWSVKKLL